MSVLFPSGMDFAEVESVLLIRRQAVLWVTGGPVERGGISKYTRQHHEPKFKSQDEWVPARGAMGDQE